MDVSSRDELDRIAAKALGGRTMRKLSPAIDRLRPEVSPNEQILMAVSGTTVRGTRCVVVATSRQLLVADEERVDSFDYERLLDLEFTESWRTAKMALRGPGAVADIKDISLDRAREMKQMVQVARRSSRVSSGTHSAPPSGHN